MKMKSPIRILQISGWSFVLAAIFVLFTASASYAGELICPPEASTVYFQTNGPNGYLRWGDWWSSQDPNAGNQPHMFEIYVPCQVAADFVIELQLYDPESYQTGSEVDEITGSAWDSATFRLVAPDGSTEVVEQIFPPIDNTSEQWNAFASFTVSEYGCGIYRLYVTTSDNDQNSYRFKVVESDPDGVADSGDEINLAPVKTTYQHSGTGCNTFSFYVSEKPELRLANFDMDGTTSVSYTDAGGNPSTGTISGNAVWNNGGGVPYPPPGGDAFSNPAAGWWSAELCVDDGNQYVFYPEGAVFIDYSPHFPILTMSKDNGLAQFNENDQVTYSFILTNNGNGPALSITMVDTLPGWTYYMSATGNATYAWVDPDEIVTWNLGVLLPGEADTVSMTMLVKEGAPSPMENCAHVSYSDVLFNEYPIVSDCDQDIVVATGSIGDYVWQDGDGDAIQDAEESGMQNVVLHLVDSGGDTTARDTTDANGNYLFTNIGAGEYTVYVKASSLPQGASLTTNNHPLPVTLAEGQDFLDADFGYEVEVIPVELTSFEAVAVPNKVLLKWTTQSETENLGFNLFRRKAAESEFQQINKTLIKGAGTSEKRHDYQYEDLDVAGGETYSYLLHDIDYEGHSTSHGPINITSVDVPKDYALEQNYPNPFNPTTTISFKLKQSGIADLHIYDMEGRLVRVLVSGYREAGSHSIIWDGRNEKGALVATGIYLCKLRVNGFEQTRKMLFAK